MTFDEILLAAADRGDIVRPNSSILAWASAQASTEAAWADCPRGEWLLWLLWQTNCPPPRDWVAREVVAFALRYAAAALTEAGLEDSLSAHVAALASATPETVGALLAAAAEAAALAAAHARAARDARAASPASVRAAAAAIAARAAAASAPYAAWGASDSATLAAGAANDAAWAASGWARAARGDAPLAFATAVRRLHPSPAAVLAVAPGRLRAGERP